MLVLPAMTTGCLPLRLGAVAYICMSAQNAARPAKVGQPACSAWTLLRVRPPLSVRISRVVAFPGTIFREIEHLVLGHVVAADGGEESFLLTTHLNCSTCNNC